MALVINTNIASVTAQRHLTESRADMEQAMERLSSGKRINSAMDDAAGLTIAHSLDAKVSSLNMAARNANDAISLINLAEGALDEVTTMLIRMRELATQSINGTYASADRTNLKFEYQALADEITRISDNTFFNGISVIGASANVTFPSRP
jgi:flagellin